MLLPKPKSEIVKNLGYCVLLILLISTNVLVTNANADADNEEKEISGDKNLIGSGTGSETKNNSGSVKTSAYNISGEGNNINSIDTTKSYDFEEKETSSKDSSSNSKNSSVKKSSVTPSSVTPDLNATKASSTPIAPNVNGSVPDAGLASSVLPRNTESSSPAPTTTVTVTHTVDSNLKPDAVSTSTSSSKNDPNVATSTSMTTANTAKVTDAPSSNAAVPGPTFPPAVSEGGSGGNNETEFGLVTDRSIKPTPATAGPPQWAIVLISLMICVSLAFTTLFFTRKYCARVRRTERRQLLSSRSQEGYFFGETNDIFNNNEDRL